MEVLTDTILAPSRTLVPPEGSPDSPLAIVGEAPGSHEVRTRRPFVGLAGQLLDDCLRAAGINRKHCYITNTIKEQPRGNDVSSFISFERGRVRTTEAFEAYRESLRGELQSTTANCIVAAGAVPLYALCDLQGITKWRGSILESTLLPGRKILPIIHPAAALRNYLFKYPIIADLKRAKAQSTFPEIRRIERNIILEPTFDQAMGFLESLLSTSLTTLDIEVLNEEVSCLSMGNRTLGYMCIPFVGDGGDYFSAEQEVAIWNRIALICQDPSITKLGQNLTFDATFLYRKLGIIVRPIEDTMIAQAILYPDLPKGLDFLTSIYTEEPYYKDEGKKYFKIGGAFRDFYLYNAKDSAVLEDIFDRQTELLRTQGNLEAYRRQRNLVEPLIAMTERGLRVDTEGLRIASAKAETEILRLREELHTCCGFDLNPNSPKQLKDYFYGTLGHKPYTNRKSGSVSTDRDALKRLSRKGAQAAKLILELRKYGKLKGTYLDMSLDDDHRLRCAFNPVGTSSGRLSSSKTIFGTGGNTQNLPPAFKEHILVDKDHIGYQIDLSQAENRDVAYIAPDPRMIEAFETGKDVHRLTASLIFDKPYDEVSDEAGSCPIGGGIYSERFWGKKANHGLNYDLGYKTFALYYEIPEADARFIVERYHRAYPGVRQYHAWVRAKLSQDRTLENSFGRRRLFLDRWSDELFKEAYSYHPQSTIAEKLNIDGVCFTYYSRQFPEVELLNQVHDSIWFQIPISVGLPRHAEIVSTIKRQLETLVPWRTRSFSIPADVEATTLNGNFGKYSKPKDFEFDFTSWSWKPIDGNLGGLQKVKGQTEDEILYSLKKIVGA